MSFLKALESKTKTCKIVVQSCQIKIWHSPQTVSRNLTNLSSNLPNHHKN